MSRSRKLFEVERDSFSGCKGLRRSDFLIFKSVHCQDVSVDHGIFHPKKNHQPCYTADWFDLLNLLLKRPRNAHGYLLCVALCCQKICC